MAYENIEEKARNFLRDVLQRTNEYEHSIINGYSIDVVNLAKSLGFQVSKVKDFECAGMIVIGEQAKNNYGCDKVIFVNSDDIYTRQKFTIAHELAHYYLEFMNCDLNNSGKDYFKACRTETYNDEEKNANKFASALLMGESKIKEFINENCFYSENDLIQSVANAFNVSFRAAEVRLSELGIIRL